MDNIILTNRVFTGTDGFLYVFLTDKVVVVPMNDKDYEHTINYMELVREGIKLKAHPVTEKEIRFKKAYHYMYHRKSKLLAV